MQRIPYPDLETLSSEKQKVAGYPERTTLNVTYMAMHIHDELWRPHLALKVAMVNATSIDPWLREVLILRTAWLANSEYELHQHLSISRNLGFTEEMQEALRTQNYESLTEEERTVAQLTDEVIATLTASDETLAKALGKGTATLAELLDPTVLEQHLKALAGSAGSASVWPTYCRASFARRCG